MEKIHRGIVIACTESSRPFYEDLCKSLKTKYPIYFSWEGIDRPHNSHEYAAVAIGKEMFDEFIFLHNSVIIKDNSLFDKLFEMEGHIALTDKFYHLMGKYVSKDIPSIPIVHNKHESIANELTWFKAPYGVFPNQLPVHREIYEQKHGRLNMILENDYMIKYKGHWGQSFTE